MQRYKLQLEKIYRINYTNQICFAVRILWIPEYYGVCGGFGDGHDP